MQGSSRDSLAEVRAALEQVLTVVIGSPKTKPTQAKAALASQSLAAELFAAADLLDTNGQLRRALTDPSQQGETKQQLARQLLADKVGPRALGLVATAAGQRWSRARDLADALEELATTAIVAGAEVTSAVDRLEDELFRFERTVAQDRELTSALSDRSAPAARRWGLVQALTEGKVSEGTTILLRRAVEHPRGRSLDASLGAFGKLSARRRGHLVATVRVARPLDEDHRLRLAAALSRLYGRSIQLVVDLDPAVLGGLRVELGDEVLDGTVAQRLADLQRQLAGSR